MTRNRKTFTLLASAILGLATAISAPAAAQQVIPAAPNAPGQVIDINFKHGKFGHSQFKHRGFSKSHGHVRFRNSHHPRFTTGTDFGHRFDRFSRFDRGLGRHPSHLKQKLIFKRKFR